MVPTGAAPCRTGPDEAPAPAARLAQGDLPDGARVAYWRKRRGLTQHAVAQRMGEPSRWVAAIERGTDRITSIETARKIAAALQIDLPLLTGRDPHPQPYPTDDPVGRDLELVRQFLEQSGPMNPGTAVPSPAVIGVALRDAWLSYHQAEYGMLIRALPLLLRDAAASDSLRVAGPDGPEAARVLSQAYQVAAAVLRKLGEYQLSWLTADRAVEAANRGGDPVLTAAAARSVSAAFLSMGRAVPAVELSRMATTRITERAHQDPTSLVVRGQLLLQSAAAAARAGAATATRDLLSEAATTAARLGRDTDRYGARFGPTTVELSRVHAAVELGEGAYAITLHARLHPTRLTGLPREQHADHWLTIARAHLQAGATDQATRALEISTRLAPTETHCPLHHAIHRHTQLA